MAMSILSIIVRLCHQISQRDCLDSRMFRLSISVSSCEARNLEKLGVRCSLGELLKGLTRSTGGE